MDCTSWLMHVFCDKTAEKYKTFLYLYFIFYIVYVCVCVCVCVCVYDMTWLLGNEAHTHLFINYCSIFNFAVLYWYLQVLYSEPWGKFDEFMKPYMYIMLCCVILYFFVLC